MAKAASLPISVKAPGKIVVWGEYAVLAGAPAQVMSINRYAQVDLATNDHLSVTSKGFEAQALAQQSLGFSAAPVAAMVETILRHWGYHEYPERLSIAQDTHAFFTERVKLGIGSSAALCVALYQALAVRLDQPTSLPEAMAIHRSFQGGTGSGLDIAASWLGGVIRFQQDDAQPATWPDNLQFCVVFTGHSANTGDHVSHFASWRATSNTSTLDHLCSTAVALDRHFDEPQLMTYINALEELDRDARLNIFTPEHRALATIADRCGVLYKPCGAGGGDIGMAISSRTVALENFRRTAQEHFSVLQMAIAPQNQT